MSTAERIWSQNDSGVLIPVGRVSDTRAQGRANFLEIRTRAKEIEQIYSDVQVPLPATSDLGRLVRNAKELWEHWFLDDRRRLNWESFFLAIHLDRIADAVLPLRGVENNVDYLKALLSGSLNFFERESSKAKDIFWELELWARLLRRNANAHLDDPPDVVVNYDNSRIGIACKKLYSERHVQNVLSEAVRQIERDFDFGIVALNLDDLLPKDVVLKKDSTNAVADKLLRVNHLFLNKHERHFQKYLSKGRLISAIVSTSIISDVQSEIPQFQNTHQWNIWTIPELEARYQEPLNRFYDTVMSHPRH